jgi:phospholipase C
VWSRTALLLTYDENDGFFDHVVPPYPPPSPVQGQSTVDIAGELFHPSGTDTHVAGPYGLGQRVPMLVISPWSKGGWVCSEVFDHTSIVRFIERRFGVPEPNISPWRRAVCGDLTSAFDFGSGDTALPALPDTGGYAPPDHDRHGDYVPTPPPNPRLPRQERGLRPARPLPYDLSADALRVVGGQLRIELDNRGRAGACFYLTSPTHPGGPWTYTVGAGRQLTAAWPAGSGYDFSVHGPNGFFRQLKGNPGGVTVEVGAHHDGDGEQVRLVLTNPGPTPVRLTVTDAYVPAHRASYHLQPGEHRVHTTPLHRSHGWYDLSVVCDGDATFLRRFAGHVETGRASASDPAVATN